MSWLAQSCSKTFFLAGSISTVSRAVLLSMAINVGDVNVIVMQWVSHDIDRFTVKGNTAQLHDCLIAARDS